jgi:ABC-type phosphate transport system auxiliary subunit
MNDTKKLQEEIRATLHRNLKILKDDVERRSFVTLDSSGFTLIPESEVYDMLTACAANLAQTLSKRLKPETPHSPIPHSTMDPSCLCFACMAQRVKP